jgi:hypothetical protein
MLAFLIITGSSLAFYLGLLVLLYRDGRKRRAKTGPIRKVTHGAATELGIEMGTDGASFIGQRSRSSGALIHFAHMSRRNSLKSHTNAGDPAEVITLPAFSSSRDRRQCS